MLEHNGTAELLAADDTVISEVDVHIIKGMEGNLQVWSGHVAPRDVGGGDWMDAVRIRLADGTEGNIVMKSVDIATTAFGAQQTGSFQGSGPAPW